MLNPQDSGDGDTESARQFTTSECTPENEERIYQNIRSLKEGYPTSQPNKKILNDILVDYRPHTIWLAKVALRRRANSSRLRFETPTELSQQLFADSRFFDKLLRNLSKLKPVERRDFSMRVVTRYLTKNVNERFSELLRPTEKDKCNRFEGQVVYDNSENPIDRFQKAEAADEPNLADGADESALLLRLIDNNFSEPEKMLFQLKVVDGWDFASIAEYVQLTDPTSPIKDREKAKQAFARMKARLKELARFSWTG